MKAESEKPEGEDEPAGAAPDAAAQEAQDLAMMARAIAFLMEHFDTVQVFATRHVDDEVGTIQAQKGAGNWCARYGQVAQFVDANRAVPDGD